MPTCRQITELATAHAEGRLRLVDRMRFRLHVGTCPGCGSYVRQLRATARALGVLPEPEVPPDLQAELLRRFEGWTPRGQASPALRHASVRPVGPADAGARPRTPASQTRASSNMP